MTLVFDTEVFVPRYRPTALPNLTLPRVNDVRWCDGRVFSPKRVRGTKRLGLQFERRVVDVLSAIYGDAFTPSQGIRYKVRNEPALAILDGVLRLGDQLVIIEVKLAHTVRVWEQLMLRYATLVRALEPQRQVRTVEVCRSYDPAVSLPGPHELIHVLPRTPRLARGAGN